MKQFTAIILTIFVLTITTCNKDDEEVLIEPIANFEASPLTISTGETVMFNDLSEGNPTQWSWEFEGGTPSTSSEKNPTVTYSQEGSFAVKLTVENGNSSDEEFKADYILVQAPASINADFSANEVEVTVGSQVQFTDISSGNPTEWDWIFSGGTPENSSDQNPIVTYSSVGEFDVMLIASNDIIADTVIKSGFIKVTDPPEQGLLAYYPLDGNGNDASANNYNGEVEGATTVSGRKNDALQFDGTDDRVIVSSIPQYPVEDQISVAAWIKTSSSSDQVEFIAAKYRALADRGFHLFIQNGGVSMAGRDGNNSYIICSSDPILINDDSWHFIVGVVDQSRWQLWVDGVLVNEIISNGSSHSLYTSDPFTLGYWAQNNNHYYTGIIDEVRLYNKALTAEEIEDLYLN